VTRYISFFFVPRTRRLRSSAASALGRRPPARLRSGRRRRRGFHRRSPPSPELRPFAFSSIELLAAGVFTPPPAFGSRCRPLAEVDLQFTSPPRVTAVAVFGHRRRSCSLRFSLSLVCAYTKLLPPPRLAVFRPPPLPSSTSDHHHGRRRRGHLHRWYRPPIAVSSTVQLAPDHLILGVDLRSPCRHSSVVLSEVRRHLYH
jgi:hypothetical protein